MKKFLFVILLLLGMLACPLQTRSPSAEEADLDLCATSAILMEPISHTVLYEKNAHAKLYPASMTKMMGLYLILEAIDEGTIHLDDEVLVSAYAASMGGTQIFLEENEKMPLEDLLKAVAINSANDAIVALGEHLCSSNSAFVQQMNEKAKEFGMTETHFNNATGFDDPEHYTSAYDMALLGCNLVSFGDKILRYTSMTEGYVREDSEDPFWLVNTNKLLRYYDGLDGLKTGFTQKAGYNLTATAMRNGVRLVSTVMNLDTIAHRSQDTIRLLDYGFSKVKAVSLFSKGEVIATFEIDKSMEQYLQGVCNEEIKIIVDRDEDETQIAVDAVLEVAEPPYRSGDRIGYIEIRCPSGRSFTYDLFAGNTIERNHFFAFLLRYLRSLFA